MTTPFGSPRALAAWALVGYAALHLFFAFFDWLLPGDGTFTGRSANAGFTNLFVMAMPVVAVLLAVHVAPVLSHAKLITTVALLEYVVSLVFGVFALLIGVGAVVDGPINSSNDAFDALAYFVMGAAALALIAVAGWVTYQAFVRLGGSLPVAMNRTPAPPPPPPPAA
jgi:hypothetical protein